QSDGSPAGEAEDQPRRTEDRQPAEDRERGTRAVRVEGCTDQCGSRQGDHTERPGNQVAGATEHWARLLGGHPFPPGRFPGRVPTNPDRALSRRSAVRRTLAAVRPRRAGNPGLAAAKTTSLRRCGGDEDTSFCVNFPTTISRVPGRSKSGCWEKESGFRGGRG